jgi:hypothetical protein
MNTEKIIFINLNITIPYKGSCRRGSVTFTLHLRTFTEF